MEKKIPCVLFILFTILAQLAYSQEIPSEKPAQQGPADQEPAVQKPADQVPSDQEESPQEGTSQQRAPWEEVQSFPVRKDPFIAGLLSWFMMGIGQIYCREYTKGSLFIAADLVDKASLVLLVAHINNKYSPETGEATLRWGSFNEGTKVLIVAYLATTLGLRFYNVIDAIQSAHRYNERMFTRRERSSLSFSGDREQFSLSYTMPLQE